METENFCSSYVFALVAGLIEASKLTSLY